MSSPVVGGETEQAYRAKWEAGGGLPAYQDNKFMSSPSPAAKQHVYSTTVRFILITLLFSKNDADLAPKTCC
jgi:hypothetical protein